MTIQQRPTPIHPDIRSVVDLDAYLDRRIAALDADCYDGETIQSIGQAAHNRSLGTRGAFADLRGMIAGWLDDVEAEQAAAAEYDRWKEAYPDADELTLRRLGGDR